MEVKNYGKKNCGAQHPRHDLTHEDTLLKVSDALK